MKIVGLMPVRSEQWCLGLSARAALMWCDELVILDHASTDCTRAICQDLHDEYLCQDPHDEYRGRVGYTYEPEGTWAEMEHRQRLLEMARRCSATHIALIDADEVLTGNMLGDIRPLVERLPNGSVLRLPWLCLRDGTNSVMASGMWGDATVSAAFPDDPLFHWAARDGYHFHHRHPMGRPYLPYWETPPRTHGLMHLQFCSKRRLLAKQALYQCIEVLRWPGRKPVHQVREMYAKTVTEAASAIVRPVPATWWAPYVDLMRYLDIDAEPWQEAEVRRLVAEHGRARFNGLDLFGVA